MLHNYLKVAFRNLTHNSVYSLINIAGLAVGLASSVLIALRTETLVNLKY
jgi:putative ABC transport system permease protein